MKKRKLAIQPETLKHLTLDAAQLSSVVGGINPLPNPTIGQTGTSIINPTISQTGTSIISVSISH